MDEGPTTVGSIVGRLKLDHSEWDADIDAVKAKLAELGASRADVKITTSGAAEAIAKIEAVKVASEVGGKSGALKTAEKDAKETESVFKRLGSTVSSVVSKINGAQVNLPPIAPMAALIGAVIGLAPALVPLAAGLTGIAGAATAMGAAGMLAIDGITRELKAGKGPLMEYKGVVAEFQGDLHHLQDVAGEGLFAGVQKAAGVLQANMKPISAVIGAAAKELGALLPVALDGILTMVERMKPAFAAGAGVIKDLVGGFDGFAHSSAFKGFVDYIVKSMPVVEGFVKALISAAGGILAALAPVGLQILKALTPVVNLLPKIVQDLVPSFKAVPPLVLALVEVLKALMPILPPLATALADFAILAASSFKNVFAAMAPGIKIIADVANTLLHYLKPAIDSVANDGNWKRGAQQLNDFFGGIEKAVGGFVSGTVKNFQSGGKQFSDAWNNTVKAFGNGGNQLNGFFDGVVTNFAHGASQLNGFFDGIVKNFQTGWSQITSGVSTAWSAILAGFQHGGAQIVSFVSSAWSSITGAFSHGLSQIISAVSTGISQVIAFFAGLGGRVMGAVSNFGSLLFSAGANLIQGLINGAESMVGGLISSVEGIASGAVNAAKSLLGIKSPSTVFHSIGQFLVQGFVNGITKGKSVAHAAIRSLVPSSMGSLNLGTSGSSLNTGAYGAGVGVGASGGTLASSSVSRTIAPAITIVNPVAVDPVTQVIQASQYALAYAGLG